MTNIVDAMILGKLFEHIFKENIKIILTSNIKISNLYKDGLQRDQFIPFIKIMEDKSIEHELQIDDDYRKSKDNKMQRFFFHLIKRRILRLINILEQLQKIKRI